MFGNCSVMFSVSGTLEMMQLFSYSCYGHFFISRVYFASKENPCLLYNPTFRYRVHRIPPLTCALNQITQIQATTPLHLSV